MVKLIQDTRGQETDQRCKDTKKKATREYERTPTHEKEYNDRRIYHQPKEDGANRK